MANASITIDVRLAWWLTPSLRALSCVASIARWPGAHARIRRAASALIRRGLTVEPRR